MKSIANLIGLAVFLFAFGAHADTYSEMYQKYYKYMINRRVSVTKDKIKISFAWDPSVDMSKVFKKGDEFEIGVNIDPKFILSPGRQENLPVTLAQKLNLNFLT